MDAEVQAEFLDGMEPVKDFKLSPAVAVATVALNFALKYHNINTVQDGTLYQQYKLEGKELIPLNLQAVFDTAIMMELHLMASTNRLSDMIMDVVAEAARDSEFLEAIDAEEGETVNVEETLEPK